MSDEATGAMAWGQNGDNLFGEARPYGAALTAAAGAEDVSTQDENSNSGTFATLSWQQ